MDECKPLNGGCTKPSHACRRARRRRAGAYTRSLLAQLELSLCPTPPNLTPECVPNVLKLSSNVNECKPPPPGLTSLQPRRFRRRSDEGRPRWWWERAPLARWRRCPSPMGWDVKVFERAAPPSEQGNATGRQYNIFLAPRGMGVIKEAGVELPEDDIVTVQGNVRHVDGAGKFAGFGTGSVSVNRGEAVKVDPMRPKLKPPGTKPLKPKLDKRLLNFASSSLSISSCATALRNVGGRDRLSRRSQTRRRRRRRRRR